eukprot:scaffold454530_cov31-Prasinocladus_malaysianus.AAC.1
MSLGVSLNASLNSTNKDFLDLSHETTPTNKSGEGYGDMLLSTHEGFKAGLEQRQGMAEVAQRLEEPEANRPSPAGALCPSDSHDD